MSCPDCFSGAVHEGKPTGTVTKLHGLDVYVAEPASGNPPKGIIGTLWLRLEAVFCPRIITSSSG